MTFALKPLIKTAFNVFTVLALFNIAPSKAVAQDPNVPAHANGLRYEDTNGRNEDLFDKSKCPKSPPFDIDKYKMGLFLRVKVGNVVDDLVAKEKAAGRAPKVFLIARAGQDMEHALVLKDEEQGRILSVADIMEGALGFRTNAYPGGTNYNPSHLVFDQRAIRSKYVDTNRKLTYSHMGILVIEDPMINTRKHYTKAEREAVAKGATLAEKAGLPVAEEVPYNGGQYWVRELLKPCEGMMQYSWRTGLMAFYQDNPHEYKSVVMVPDQRIQDLIYSFLIDPKKDTDQNYKKFLANNYNIAATYRDLVDQNSNGFFLEVMAAAMMMRDQQVDFNKTKRVDYLNYLHQTGYRPTKIIPSEDSFLLRHANTAVAGWFMDTLKIRDEDHPFSRPYGVTEIVTELSIREYMLRRNVIHPAGVHQIDVTEADIKKLSTNKTLNPANPKK